jgi:hypothetical protein
LEEVSLFRIHLLFGIHTRKNAPHRVEN